MPSLAMHSIAAPHLWRCNDNTQKLRGKAFLPGAAVHPCSPVAPLLIEIFKNIMSLISFCEMFCLQIKTKWLSGSTFTTKLFYDCATKSTSSNQRCMILATVYIYIKDHIFFSQGGACQALFSFKQQQRTFFNLGRQRQSPLGVLILS